jgi:predicted metal-dependent HD superfamily phosphohydrolase
MSSLFPAPFPAPLDASARAESWEAAWSALGRTAPLGLRQALEEAWSEPHRHYHDTGHLGECLALLARWRGLSERPGEVAIALWFHDAVCDPKASGNEVKSAAWAARALITAGLASETAQRVYELVMATRHDKQVRGRDAQLLVDIDLAILGSPSERFQTYDQDVRKEYASVPGLRYRRLRAAVLRGFAHRPQLYHCAPAVDLLEAQARINLAAAISRLAQ